MMARIFFTSHPKSGSHSCLICSGFTILHNCMGIQKVIACFFVAITLCFIACNDTDIPDIPETGYSSIQFKLFGITADSRAAVDSKCDIPVIPMSGGDVTCKMSYAPLTGSRAAVVDNTDQMQSFGVYAHRTEDGDRHSFYFSNQQIKVNTGGTCSSAVEHTWPDDKTMLQFFAYYPYNSDNITLPVSADEKFSFSWQVPQDMAEQEDLMVSKSQTFLGDAYVAVPLHFEHLCSQVVVRLDEGLEDFKIQSVSFLGIRNTGTYTFGEGWQLQDSVTDFEGLGTDASTNGEFVFMMLPQQTSASAELRVTIHNHISGTDQTYGMTLGQEWLQGYRLTYLVSLTPEFDLKFVSQSQQQDAHYVIYPIDIHAEDISVGWTVQSDSEWATVTSSLTDLQAQGFWIEDDKGTQTVSGNQSADDMTVYVFLTENTGDVPRTATLSLYPSGYLSTGNTPF